MKENKPADVAKVYEIGNELYNMVLTPKAFWLLITPAADRVCTVSINDKRKFYSKKLMAQVHISKGGICQN